MILKIPLAVQLLQTKVIQLTGNNETPYVNSEGITSRLHFSLERMLLNPQITDAFMDEVNLPELDEFTNIIGVGRHGGIPFASLLSHNTFTPLTTINPKLEPFENNFLRLLNNEKCSSLIVGDIATNGELIIKIAKQLKKLNHNTITALMMFDTNTGAKEHCLKHHINFTSIISTANFGIPDETNSTH